MFDFILRPVIAFLWEPASLKRSHWWHWNRSTYSDPGHMLLIDGYKKAKKRNSFWRNLIQTNFAWKMTAVISPVDYQGEYQLGYIEVDRNGRKNKNTCALILEGETAVLRGPEDVLFYGTSYPKGENVELKFIAFLSKKELNGITLI